VRGHYFSAYGAPRPPDVTISLMKWILWVALAGAAFGQALPSIPVPAALDRLLRDYEKAWTAKDARALAALFTEDGFVLSSGKPMVRGRAAITAHYQGSGGPLALRAVAAHTEGVTGYIIGALTLRRVNGRWLIFSDMDNGNSR